MISNIGKYFYTYLQKAYDSRAGNEGMKLTNLDSIHVKNAKVLHSRDALVSCMKKNAIVAEIGVNKGRFSEIILDISKPKKLHLVDLWGSSRYNSKVESNVREKFSDQISDNIIEINKGFSTEILNNFQDHYFDWVYIDSDHGYEVTMNELEILDYKIKNDGIICGHDYISRSRKKGRKYGVIEAVHEFCSSRNYEIIYITLETLAHNSFAIRKIIT